MWYIVKWRSRLPCNMCSIFANVKKMYTSEDAERKYSILKCEEAISGQMDNDLFLFFSLCFSIASFSTVSLYGLMIRNKIIVFEIIE